MRRLRIYHLTEYQFSDQVDLLPHQILCRPRGGHDLRIESSILNVSPTAKVKWYRDLHGNSVGRLAFNESTNVLRIESDVTVTHYEIEPLDFIIDDYAVCYPFNLDPHMRTSLFPFMVPCFPNSRFVQNWIQQFWIPGQSPETYTLLCNLNQSLAKDFRYQSREEPGVQRPDETLSKMSGSCRDLATLYIETCRYLGLAARFVSGYLHNPGSDQHGSTHAWSEVFLPGAGWKGFDSTSGIVAGADHIAAAVGRHPEEIPPVSGSFKSQGNIESNLRVQVDVTVVQ